MIEKVTGKPRRWIPKIEYRRRNGLSDKTLTYLIESNQIPVIRTESGTVLIDTQPLPISNFDVSARLDKQEKMLTALCQQFNVKT